MNMNDNWKPKLLVLGTLIGAGIGVLTAMQMANAIEEEGEDWSQFGIGVTLGWKFVSSNGFVVDIHGGGGRYFGDTTNAPGGFARIGVNLGYRF